MFAALAQKPLHLAASVATKIQVTATHVALKAARMATHLSEKAARTQAMSAARAAEAVRARALKAASRPGIRFVRDVRHGSMRFSFYRSTDKGGATRTFWTLNRETSRGPKRLATGTMDEFRDIRRMAERLPKLQQTHEPRRVRHSPEKRTHVEPRQEQRRPREERASEEKPRERWHSVVFMQGSLGRGTAQGRVVRNFRDENQAIAAARNNPRLAVYRTASEKPRPQGAIITASEAHFFRPRPQQQCHASPDANRVNGLARANGHELDNTKRLQQSR